MESGWKVDNGKLVGWLVGWEDGATNSNKQKFQKVSNEPKGVFYWNVLLEMILKDKEIWLELWSWENLENK